MRLKELRIERGLTQTEVATAISTSQRNIGRWENLENEPTANFIIALANFFQVSTDFLLGIEDDFGIKKNGSAFVPSGYTKEEQQLIENYRELNPACKKLVKQTVETLIASSAAGGQNKDAE